MKKYKRKELESFREIFRNKQGTRAQYLAYAFLRGVPYRVVEPKTNWDYGVPHYNKECYLPGELVYRNFKYDICRSILELALKSQRPRHSNPNNLKFLELRKTQEYQEFEQKYKEWNKRLDETVKDVDKELEAWFLAPLE